MCPHQDSNLRITFYLEMLYSVGALPCFPSQRADIGNRRRIPDYLQTNQKACYSATPPMLATHRFFRGSDWLPTSGYRHQSSYITVCPLLTSLTVGQPWLFQPYTSFLLQPQENLFRNFPRTLWAVYPLFGHFVSFS